MTTTSTTPTATTVGAGPTPGSPVSVESAAVDCTPGRRPHRSGLAGLGGRSLVGVASQVVYGLSNFVLLGVVAATGSDAVVGATALVYLLVLLWQSIGRGLTGDALLMRSSVLDHDDRRRVFGGALSVAVLVALPAALGTALLGKSSVGTATACIIAAAVVPVIVHDTTRLALIAVDRTARALLGDGVWLATQVLAMVVLGATHRLDVRSAFAAWGLGALCGAVTNLVALRPSWSATASATTGPDIDARATRAEDPVAGGGPLRATRLFLDRTAGTRLSLVLSNSLAFVSRNLTYSLIGLVGGLATLGVVRRGLVPFAALTATFLGLAAVFTPTLARAPATIGPVVRRLAAGCAAVAALWGATVIGASALGVSWIEQVIGDDTVLVAWLAAALVAQGVATAAVAGLRAAGRPRDNAWGVGVGLVIMVAAVWPLTSRFGAAGGAAALALGNAVEALFCAAALALALRHEASDPSDRRHALADTAAATAPLVGTGSGS